MYTENGVIEWPSLAGLAVFADAQVAHPLDRRLLEVKGEAEALVRTLLSAPLLASPHPRPYLHPGAAGNLLHGEQVVAKFGRLHPQLARAYDLPPATYAFFLYLENIPQYPPVQHYEALPKFPGTTRDIAVVVDERYGAGELTAAALETAAPYLVSVEAFDEYRGPKLGAGKKSLALRIVLRRPRCDHHRRRGQCLDRPHRRRAAATVRRDAARLDRHDVG